MNTKKYAPVLLEYREKYLKNLSASVIPFWYKNSPDWEQGGSFSCLDHQGNVYDSKKYVWMVARSAWMFARLYNVFNRNPEHLEMAELGIDYLWQYARDDQGRYYFSLTRKGEPWFYQRKPYGAAFAMMAYLEYFKATGKVSYKKEAIDLFWKIHQWIQDPARLGRPSMQGVPAMTNLADVMVSAGMALELAAVESDPQYEEVMISALKQCKRHFYPELKILMENVPLDPSQNIMQWPEGRLFNPGHSIEVAWFGYCDRHGTLTHNSKGNHYKGFFHVPRALLFCVQEIDKYISTD